MSQMRRYLFHQPAAQPLIALSKRLCCGIIISKMNIKCERRESMSELKRTDTDMPDGQVEVRTVRGACEDDVKAIKNGNGGKSIADKIREKLGRGGDSKSKKRDKSGKDDKSDDTKSKIPKRPSKFARLLHGYKSIMFHGATVDRIVSWAIPIGIIGVIVTCFVLFSPFFQPIDIHTNEFIEQLRNENVTELHISPSDGSVSGKFDEPVDGKTEFKSSVQESSDTVESLILDSKDMQYDFDKPAAIWGFLSNIMFVVIQFGIVFGGLYWLMNSSSVGKSLGADDEDDIDGLAIPDTTFDDVVGIPEAIEEMREVVTFLQDPDMYMAAGANFPRGILLQGPAGCGKTLLARALAGEAGVPFIAQSGSDFVEMFVGMGAKRVRKLFEEARKNQPSIVFIDEIDAIGSKRTNNIQTTSEEIQTINALLTEMDGFNNSSAVVVIGATNRADVLDPALMRPGRFDRVVTVEQPAKEGRKEILQHYAVGRPFAEPIDFDRLAAHTYGFSGAQLENVMNQAATLAARRSTSTNEKPLITAADIDEGIARTISGPAMKSRQMSDREKRLVAYHEAGHAVVQYLLDGCDDVQKISIVSRNIPGQGAAMGYVQSYSEEDSYITTEEQCNDELAALLAGRAAEKRFCGIRSAGAADDLKQASKLAYKMANEFGFQSDPSALPVRRGTYETLASERRLEGIERRVDDLSSTAYRRADKLLCENVGKVRWIVDTLISNETISSEEIKDIMDGETPSKYLAADYVDVVDDKEGK